MQLSFSLASIDDVEELVQGNLLDYDSSVLMLHPLTRFPLTQWWGSPELFRWHLSLINKAGGGVLLARTQTGDIVGELEYIPGDGHTHIFWLYVHPEYRRKGIARALLSELQVSTLDEIWVEPEDIRSERLYREFGSVIRILRNFEIIFSDGYDPPKSSLHPILTGDLGSLKGKKRVIGQYNVSQFDLMQLQESIGSVAEFPIWGETLPPVVAHYQNGISALITQYLRVYSNSNFEKSELEKVLQDCIRRIYTQGLAGVNFQIYDDEEMVSLLLKLGAEEQEETMDPIYVLSKSSI